MPDVLGHDTPIRSIEPGDAVPAPPDRLPLPIPLPVPNPVPATFANELRKIFAGLLGK